MRRACDGCGRGASRQTKTEESPPLPPVATLFRGAIDNGPLTIVAAARAMARLQGERRQYRLEIGAAPSAAPFNISLL